MVRAIFVLVLCTVLSIGFSSILQAEQKYNSSSYSIIAKRNIFRPLWAVSTAKIDDISRKEELEALRKAEQERQQTQKTAEEESKINLKKREIEQNYTLTGIMLDNGKKQAVIQDKKGSTSFLYENEMLGDARIISINNQKSEVTIDYQGKFTVLLKIE